MCVVCTLHIGTIITVGRCMAAFIDAAYCRYCEVQVVRPNLSNFVLYVVFPHTLINANNNTPLTDSTVYAVRFFFSFFFCLYSLSYAPLSPATSSHSCPLKYSQIRNKSFYFALSTRRISTIACSNAMAFGMGWTTDMATF